MITIRPHLAAFVVLIDFTSKWQEIVLLNLFWLKIFKSEAYLKGWFHLSKKNDHMINSYFLFKTGDSRIWKSGQQMPGAGRISLH